MRYLFEPRSALSLFALFATSLVYAQSDRATVTGRVTDATDAAVANATVVISNQETGIRSTTRTNDAGNYVVGQLPAGKYEVTIEAPGFRRSVRKDTELSIAQTLALNVMLEVGQVEQQIEVTGAAPLVESATSDLGTVVNRERIIDLPLQVSGNMRHPGSFVFLAPGVTGDTSNTQINGSQNRSKEILMDGIGSTSPESGGLIFTYPPVESISEFKLVSSNFSAEYGRSGAGFEVYTTRSGTNEFHGSVWEYLRNEKLDARGFIARTRAINKQNEFGVAFGGPILLPKLYNGRNRTFFHFVYGGYRFRAGALNELVSFPTTAMQRGDFSGVTRNGQPVIIYNPATTRADGAGGFTRDPFPGNIIPQNQFSAVSRRYLQFLPTPSNSSQLNNFQVVGSQSIERNVWTGKFDHQFSDKNRVNFFVFWNEQSLTDPERLPGALSPALDEQRPARWLRLNHDYLFGPTVLNNLRAGYTREPQVWSRTTSGQGYLQQLGLTGVNPPGDILPRIMLGDGLTSWGDQTKNTGKQVNNTLQIADTLSWVRGNHSFKFGGDGRWMQTNGADPANQQGRFFFNSNETAFPTAAGRANSGHSFASLLLGQVDAAEYNALLVVPGNRYQYWAAFVQDDWKITRKLTLNLGLRWEYFAPRREHNDNFSSFDPSLPNPGAGGRPGAVSFLGTGPGRDDSRNSFADSYWKNFGPRVGFAYQLFNRTVLRGGYTMFYGPGNATQGLRGSQNFLFGFNGSPSYATLDAGVTPAFNWDSGFPSNWPRPPFIDPTVQNGSNVNMIGRGDARPPYFQNFQFSVQQEVITGLLLEASYVGVKGTRLGTGLFNINEVDPSYLSLGSTLTQNITSPAAAAAGITAPYAGFRGSVAQALRPYPQYLNVVNNSNPNGNSTYHALQTKVERRFARGLTVLGAYTWAKTISDGDVSAGGGPSGQTFYNRRLEKAVSTNDVPHVVAISYTWELPFGPGKPFLNSGGIAGRVVGGWQLTGIHQYQSGRPIALTANSTLPIFNGILRPDANSDVTKRLTPADPLAGSWINPAAFSAPTGFRLGTSARAYTDLRADEYLNESFGLIKRTPLWEKVTLTFRAEFFNAFNRTVFNAPVGNVSAGNFGRVTQQSNTPRQGQVALRIDF
ncbi:MAG: TonB-dependent receptor [Bryobacteraceae bacterium]|nr:TonB-dependent receptor [Bryobacteraceae bacterium]